MGFNGLKRETLIRKLWRWYYVCSSIHKSITWSRLFVFYVRW